MFHKFFGFGLNPYVLHVAIVSHFSLEHLLLEFLELFELLELLELLELFGLLEPYNSPK